MHAFDLFIVHYMKTKSSPSMGLIKEFDFFSHLWIANRMICFLCTKIWVLFARIHCPIACFSYVSDESNNSNNLICNLGCHCPGNGNFFFSLIFLCTLLFIVSITIRMKVTATMKTATGTTKSVWHLQIGSTGYKINCFRSTKWNLI